jgi:cell wall-associated NlpC family hydrolase
MTTHAVDRLHHDISALKKAEHNRDHDAAKLHNDTRGAKHEHNVAVRQRDEFQKGHKALMQERDALSRLQTTEKNKLAPMDQQLAALDPTSSDPAVQAQIAALQQSEAGVHGQFDPKIAAESQRAQQLKSEVDQHRLAASTARTAGKHDRDAMKKDAKALAHAKSAVQRDRQRGRKDLEPAEYKMGLKGTNDARKALGLHAVNHVIRPDQKLGKAVDIAKAAVALEAKHGTYDYTESYGARTNYGHGPTSRNSSGRISFDCSGFVGAVYKKAGLPSPYTVGYEGTSFDVAGCKNMKKVSEKDAKPGDVVVFPDHIALYVGHGKCISMGQQGDPKEVTVAEEAAYKNRGIQGFYHPKGA